MNIIKLIFRIVKGLTIYVVCANWLVVCVGGVVPMFDFPELTHDLFSFSRGLSWVGLFHLSLWVLPVCLVGSLWAFACSSDAWGSSSGSRHCAVRVTDGLSRASFWLAAGCATLAVPASINVQAARVIKPPPSHMVGVFLFNILPWTTVVTSLLLAHSIYHFGRLSAGAVTYARVFKQLKETLGNNGSNQQSKVHLVPQPAPETSLLNESVTASETNYKGKRTSAATWPQQRGPTAVNMTNASTSRSCDRDILHAANSTSNVLIITAKDQ
eukprot:GHVT01000590.1.p1 GENE.GHVT01000590.1~~GHVT01000590.1.p1  ORF type:complete len:270 (-),score=29.03 GHVT01000590.1:964-1773(-)